MIASIRKILGMLSPSMRRRWLWMIPLTVTAALVEACGAAAVYALIKLLGDPAAGLRLPVVGPLLRQLPWHGDRQIVLIFAATVAAFYLMKNALLGFVLYVQNTTIGHSMAMLSRRILRGYLAAPYSFHLRRNSAQLIHNSSGAVEMIFRNLVSSGITIAAEALVVIGIFAVLTVTAPVVTLVAGTFLVALLALLLRLTQRAIRRWGEEVQRLKTGAFKSVQQALGGLKEAKVLGHEEFFLEAFAERHDRLSYLLNLHAALFNLPRLLIETIFIGATLLMIILLSLQGALTADMVPLLGLFAYAGFRIIPSANRIMMNLSLIRYAMPALDDIASDLEAIEGCSLESREANGATAFFRDRLELQGVSFTYEGGHAPALQEVDLTVRRGESVGIVGPTGAGKSTLVDVILGLLPPSHGRILVDGVDISRVLRSWRRLIGYVPQSVYLLDDTLRRNVAFGLPDAEIDETRVKAALSMAQLDDFVRELPLGQETAVGERGVRLSGGQRQRVAIARALYHEPEILVFDEATSALDNRTERAVTEAIESLQGKKTLIIVAHRLSTVRMCDRLVFLHRGQIGGCGTYENLLESNADFRNMAAAAGGSRSTV